MPSPLEAIIGAAESAVGVNYVWGGNSLAAGVDCSGLVQQAFAAAGIPMPRVSAAQARVGQQIGSINEAKPGDLLSWDNSSRNNGADHIAIYIGNGMMIEAPRRGAKVQVVPVPRAASPRGLLKVNRVIGVVRPTQGVMRAPTLGPNQDRRYTAAAVGSATPGAPQPQAPAPTAAQSVIVQGEQGGGLGDGLPPDATPEQTEEYIREHFPSVAPFLANPEIREVLFEAAEDDWSPVKLDQRLRQTEYFKTHAAPSRDVDIFLGTAGMAERNRVINKAKDEVRSLFEQNGMNLDPDTISKLTMESLRAGDINLEGQIVNQEAMNKRLAFGLGAQKGGMPEGAASLNADTLGMTAKQYLVPVTRQALEDWTRRILAGSATEETFVSWLRGQARAAFRNDPEVLESLEEGTSPMDHFQAHRAAIAQTLELDESQVDLMDRRYRDVLSYRDPTDAKGQPRSMTWVEAEKWARQQTEFKDTRQYEMGAAEMRSNLARFFGEEAA